MSSMKENRIILNKITDYKYEIPRNYKSGMKTNAIIYATEKMVSEIQRDLSLEQAANVAMLPGIIGSSLVMPDVHQGYGFPIGGVAAMDYETGIISPGGVGYDINCGVRMLRTNLTVNEIKPKLKELVDTIFRNVPSGVGSEGKIHLSISEIDEVLNYGAEWAVKKGYGTENDLRRLEENGKMKFANSDKVSIKAKQRGIPQIGSLGAGNHFLEIQKVEDIYLPDIAQKLGITSKEQIIVMIHTGSRGAGHQIATDYIDKMRTAIKRYNILLPDKELACTPITSEEGQAYLQAMGCGANYAWANRQMITHWVRESFEHVLRKSSSELGLEIIYDVAHNIAKVEEHELEGKKRKVVVHRKGATRAFGPYRDELSAEFRTIGQPVLIPGDMGSASYILIGTETAMNETFGSTCHGAGRRMSRSEAFRKYNVQSVQSYMNSKGIYLHAATKEGIIEEAPGVYKNIDDVVHVVDSVGISKRVAKMVPIGVIKG